MDILYIVPYVPNLVRVRSYNLIRCLQNRHNRVTLVCLWANEEELAGIEALKAMGFSVHGYRQTLPRTLTNGISALRTGQPLQAWYSWNPEMAHGLASLIRDSEGRTKYDVIHVEHLRGVNYGLDLNRIQNRLESSQLRRIPIVWDSVDCISYLFRQSAAYSRSIVHKKITNYELPRTEAFEGNLVKQFSKILVTSDMDKRALMQLSREADCADRIEVISNGVDLGYFHPNPELPREDGTIVFSGKMSYHANITMVLFFVEEIFPLILDRRPDAQLWIVGKDPGKKIKDLEAHPNITVTGTVPDIRSYLQRASVAIVPLVYGAGNQLKLLENMACATPVIATSRAALPLQAQPERDLLVADKPVDFAEQTLRLLNDSELRISIGIAGRDYVVRNHDWASITERLEGVYHAVIQATN